MGSTGAAKKQGDQPLGGIYTQEESENYLAAAGAFQASIDAEPLVPAEVRRIRKKLGFESERSGIDLWPGIRAFSQ